MTNLQSFMLTRGWNVIGLSFYVYCFLLFVIFANLFPFFILKSCLVSLSFSCNLKSVCGVLSLHDLPVKINVKVCLWIWSHTVLFAEFPCANSSVLLFGVLLFHVFAACVSVWDWWHSLSYRQVTVAHFRVFKSYNHLIDRDSHLPLEGWYDLLLS